MNAGCISPSKIEAGEEGVLIYKPWIFGHGGVDADPITTGLTWTVWSTGVTRYNIKPMKATEPFKDVTASDNVAIDFNSYLTLQIQEGKTPILHEDSGKEWYSNKVKDYYRTVVRNEARTRSSIELRISPQAINDAQQNIHDIMAKYLKDIDLPVKVVKVVIGQVTPPQDVLDEAERTAAQKQRNATEKARASAELDRKQAEINKALADRAYAKQFKMTTDQFLENKRLDIMQQAVLKKDGDISLIMNASNATPIFNVK
jgi:regulator of protease activity HflC (stomatin/prohibitin superfamily)